MNTFIRLELTGKKIHQNVFMVKNVNIFKKIHPQVRQVDYDQFESKICGLLNDSSMFPSQIKVNN